MGKSQRTKGHNFERWVAKQFRTLFPTAKRGFQTRGGGAEEADVVNVPFHIECKVGKQPNIKAAMQQACDDTQGLPPVVVTKQDFHQVLVTMHWDTFMTLLQKSESSVEGGMQ